MTISRWIGLFVLGGLALLGWFVEPVAAAPEDPAPLAQGVDNQVCLSCHSAPGQTLELPSGEQLYITVDPEVFDASVHGRLGYACVQCHTDITGYPHPEVSARTRREFVLENYRTCATCHEDKYNMTLDSVHQRALAAGNDQAAVCTDCHGVHNIDLTGQLREQVPHMCEQCHSQIYNLYAESAHGAALIDENNPDVPTCVDCHGVHTIAGPSNSEFHLFSPQICAQCHADAALMGRYGISTDVFNTYLTDFHGTTVQLFEKIAPDQETNKPVCIDCHGVHNIRPSDDPQSTVMKSNLLDTCRRCHPDATTNFPDSWLSHYVPSQDRHPLVYYVNLFYKIFIPAVLGGMVVYNLTDVGRLFRRFVKDRFSKERRNE
jgi:predicted CXXCH cytochrome family protein